METDKIYAKIQNLSVHWPTTVNPGQSKNPKSTLGFTERIPWQPTTQEPDLASFGDDAHAMIARLLTNDQNFRVIPITDGYRFQQRNKGELMQSGRSQCREVQVASVSPISSRQLLRE